MKVLMLSLNYAPEPIGIALYSTGTARALAEAGHEVEVVCAKPYYPHWELWDGYEGGRHLRERDGTIGVTRCAHYVPAHPNGMRRLAHHASFAANATGPMLQLASRWRPDLVLAVAPSLLAAPVAQIAARRAGAKMWLHVQDFEVEAARATKLLGGWTGGAGNRFESAVLQGADIVSSISPRMCEKLIAKGVAPERVVEFRNWAALDTILPGPRDTRFRREWGLDDRTVAFCSGNIGDKQGIGTIIEVARLLQSREDLVFVICGDGPNREKLIAQAGHLPNLVIKPLQPAERLGELLATADICLLSQLPGMADLVLPSKFANMLAAGRPVLANARPGTGLYAEMEGVGLCTPPGDAAAMADALVAMISDPVRLAAMAGTARHRAETVWNPARILGDFVSRAEALAAA